VNQAASTKDLRSFGLLVGGVLSVIGAWPLLYQGEPLRLWALGVGGLLMILGGILPQALAPVHKGWMWIGHILGWINTRILLGIVFYGLITPIGIVFRLMGKDTMRQAFSEQSSTYRVVRQPRARSHMKFQF
jgi:saxitoxin biosynthesis operon SxtJ-like protein